MSNIFKKIESKIEEIIENIGHKTSSSTLSIKSKMDDIEEIFHNITTFTNHSSVDKFGSDLEKISKDLVNGTMKTINTIGQDICMASHDLDHNVKIGKIAEDIISIINHLKYNMENTAHNLKNDIKSILSDIGEIHLLGENNDNVKD